MARGPDGMRGAPGPRPTEPPAAPADRGGRPRLVKLVRDGVGRFLPPGATGVYYKQIPDRPEGIRALRRKGIEEAVEYLETPSLGELADMYEVILALAKHDLGVTMGDVAQEAARKRGERGGFDGLIGMYVDTSAPPRHE